MSVSFFNMTGGTGGGDGQSVYEAALEGGYTGSEEDFYRDLAALSGLADVVFPAVPVTVTARDGAGPLAGQPLSVKTPDGGEQTTKLDANGEFRSNLRILTEYVFKIMPKSEDDDIFTAYKKILTGDLNIPLLIEILVDRFSDIANISMWERIKDVIESNRGKTTTKSASVFGNVGSGNNKWAGGVLAPNGKIYGIPANSTTVLEIDPETKSASVFGSLSDANKWGGGALAPNGKIYGMPSDSTSVLEFDPETKVPITLGSVANDIYKWAGGVLAPNGKIYGIPNIDASIFEFDPETKVATTLGSLSGSGKWAGGVLAPNGKIYGIPHNSTTVLEFDTETKVPTTFGSLSGSGKWNGGVLAPNGKIYGIPQGSTSVLEIDPETKSASVFGNVGSGNKWIGGALAPNGKIYGIPHSSTSVLEIDPEIKSASVFGNVGSDASKWVGGVLAPNGKIYGIPQGSTSVLEIDLGTDLTPITGLPLLSAYINKY